MLYTWCCNAATERTFCPPREMMLELSGEPLTLDPPYCQSQAPSALTDDRFFHRWSASRRRIRRDDSLFTKKFLPSFACKVAFTSFLHFSLVRITFLVCRPSTNSCAKAVARCASSRSLRLWGATLSAA